MKRMELLTVRLPQQIVSELEKIKDEEKISLASLIRDAVTNYLKERRQQNALAWFIENFCKKCEGNCRAGSWSMLQCLFRKIEKEEGTEEENVQS